MRGTQSSSRLQGLIGVRVHFSCNLYGEDGTCRTGVTTIQGMTLADVCNKRAAHPPGAFTHLNEYSVAVVASVKRLYYKFFA